MKTEYYVNKEKRIVVCKIHFYADHNSWVVTAKAKCSPDDIFDEEIGRKLANTRCHTEYHRKMKQVSEKEVNYLTERLNKANKNVAHHKQMVSDMTIRAKMK